MQIAVLSRSDAPSYRSIMLEAYAANADAYTSTVEERASEPLSWWENRIGSPGGFNQCFGAFDGGELVGTVALEFFFKPKTRHSALVLGMYVRPAWRRRGIGRQLVATSIQAARQRPEIQLLRLTLTEGNDSARRLYEAAGFTVWGTELLAIRATSGFKSKVYMAMLLAHAKTAAQLVAGADPPRQPPSGRSWPRRSSSLRGQSARATAGGLNSNIGRHRRCTCP